MNPTEAANPNVEADERFPSGPWTGFFLLPTRPGRHWMELDLKFRDGLVGGDGRDSVGPFRITGRYTISDGKCRWTKTYLGKHSLFYQGYNEGKGIWGNWEMTTDWRGGFHVWPVAMGDPTQARLAGAIDEPARLPEIFEPVGVGEAIGVSVGEPCGSPLDEALS
jgi:hypothetical protein